MKTILPSIIRSFILVGLVLTHVHSLSFKEVYRRLSCDFIAGYRASSTVSDQNAMDLDQEMMEEQLELANEESFANALRIYTEGAHTRMVAQITLTSPLPKDIAKGTRIIGTTPSGNQVILLAYDDNLAGSEYMNIQYQASESQRNYVMCRVGASVDPMTKGCMAEEGEIRIDPHGDYFDEPIEIGYSYNILENNIAKRSLQSLYNEVKGTKTYESFENYYGKNSDFANQIVLAAFAGGSTELQNFNMDFGAYGYSGREQIIKKTTVLSIMWMYVVHMMEDAVDHCESKCTFDTCNDGEFVSSWDMAVVFYTGMLEGDNGQGSGKLLYALADKRCANFKTCGEGLGFHKQGVSGSSKVNLEIFKNFKKGLGFFKTNECSALRETKDSIKSLMYIPLIQTTLRYAWKMNFEPPSEKNEAQGIAAALAIVPAIWACDESAGNTIAQNMFTRDGRNPDFSSIKAAFEATYECLGVDGAIVGGLYDAENETYLKEAEPYGYVEGEHYYGYGEEIIIFGISTDRSLVVWLLLTILGVVSLVCTYILCKRRVGCCNRSHKKSTQDFEKENECDPNDSDTADNTSDNSSVNDLQL